MTLCVPPTETSKKHIRFLRGIFLSSTAKTVHQDIELVCCNGSLRYNKLLVGLLFPEVENCSEYQLSISSSLLLPQHTVDEIFDQFNKYFGELNSETGLVTSENRETRDGGIDEASDCENYEEIVTEFVVPSEEVESLEADEGGHEVPEGDRESIERGLQPLERENKALEESQEHVDTVEDAIDTEGSARKRCHPCVHCTEIFMHRSSLLRHIKSKHRTVAASSGKENNSAAPDHHQCSVCQKTFRFRTHLINHENTHSKPHKCGQCDETFAEATKLASHEINVHGELVVANVTSGALIKCCFCPKVFPARSQAVLHERTHTKERPFQCSICSKRFAAKCNLTAHERIHAGESKRYACRHCDRKFSHTSERKDHETVHTGERPYMCPICGESYRRNANLWRHKRRCQVKEGGLKVGEVESQKVEEEVELVECDVARDELDHLNEEEEAKYQIVFVDPGPSRGGRDNEVPQVASEQVVVAS